MLSFRLVNKCDVEGAEVRVFRGAIKALNTRDAPILFEINSQAARTANNPVKRPDGSVKETPGKLPKETLTLLGTLMSRRRRLIRSS